MDNRDYRNSAFRSVKSFSELQAFPSGASSTSQKVTANNNTGIHKADHAQLSSSTFGQLHLSAITTSTSTTTTGSQFRKRNMDATMSSSPTNKKFRRATSSQPDESEPPPSAASANGERPRLTEQEKKNNHIASEQKRRQAIREGFDRLTELVPGLEGQGRSESVVLRKSVDFMRKEVEERRKLVARIDALGGEVPESLR